jgi:CRP/FNR family transcriptional regulator, nitrogen fixation regulation protein
VGFQRTAQRAGIEQMPRLPTIASSRLALDQQDHRERERLQLVLSFLCDGRRQIGGFYLLGDIFGLEIDKEHQFSAEGIKDVTVLVVRRSAIVSLAERDCDVARELWSFTGRELNRVQEHLLLLVKSAQQRVAFFLLEMSARLAATDAIELPMSRQDIADYLGLTIETVSRTMTQLASERAIGPSARRVVLRNSGALRQLNA